MDIFGLQAYPQVKQVADRLSAEAGAVVAVPDVFRGAPWSMDRLPPKAPVSELLDWVKGPMAYQPNVRDGLDKTLAALRARGRSSFGIVGFCWGASIALEAAAAGGGFAAAAG